jgi:hypothetical protein
MGALQVALAARGMTFIAWCWHGYGAGRGLLDSGILHIFLVTPDQWQCLWVGARGNKLLVWSGWGQAGQYIYDENGVQAARRPCNKMKEDGGEPICTLERATCFCADNSYSSYSQTYAIQKGV